MMGIVRVGQCPLFVSKDGHYKELRMPIVVFCVKRRVWLFGEPLFEQVGP